MFTAGRGLGLECASHRPLAKWLRGAPGDRQARVRSLLSLQGFDQIESYQWLRIGTPVVILSGALHYRVSAGAG